MTRTQPLSTIRRIRGGTRLANRLTHLADVRDRSVLGRLVRGSGMFPKRPIPMYWFSRVPNLGDVVSSVIVEHLSGGTPVLVSPRFPRKLLACGSVVTNAAPGDWVWGSGAIRDEPITPPEGVVFYAVRGPLTAGLIRADVPEVYGDPAQLLPRIFTPHVEKRFELGVIPHYIESDLVTFTDPSILRIDVLAPWKDVVEAIVSCRAILSSSLHGLIVAETYGVPAVWMAVTDKVIGEGFKFRDYYLSTGREPPEPLPWKHAIETFDHHLTEPPELDVEPLVNAWPEELSFEPEGANSA